MYVRAHVYVSITGCKINTIQRQFTNTLCFIQGKYISKYPWDLIMKLLKLAFMIDQTEKLRVPDPSNLYQGSSKKSF